MMSLYFCGVVISDGNEKTPRKCRLPLYVSNIYFLRTLLNAFSSNGLLKGRIVFFANAIRVLRDYLPFLPSCTIVM